MSKEQLKTMILNITEKQEGEYSWEEIAEGLYNLLDDIDTSSDVFKPEMNNFYKYVMKKQGEKNKYAYSPNGYKLIFNVKRVEKQELDVENVRKIVKEMQNCYEHDIDGSCFKNKAHES